MIHVKRTKHDIIIRRMKRHVHMRLLSLVFLWAAFFSVVFPIGAETLFEQGEKLFVNNEPARAVLVLENAVKEDPANAKTYQYLGIAYEQLEQYENAISAYERGLASSSALKDTFYFNMANNYLRLGQTDKALEYYGKSVTVNGSFAPSYLNRGNLRVKKGSYREAVSDYQTYLVLKPNDPQKGAIDKMISLLSGAVQEEERKKLEEQRRQKEEAARQQALLDQVLGSLENAGSDTTNLSAGTEKTEDYEGSFDIID